jgi:L-xylulokinase
MKTMKYLLGIDNGGTFSKAALFTEDGNQIVVASEATQSIMPVPGYIERDMDELWEVNARVIRKVVELSGIDSCLIAGVSFSGHGKGLYLVDKTGKPAYKGILSTDTRAWKYVKKWQIDGTQAKTYEKTCQKILACQPVSLLAWLKDNKPEVLQKSRYIFAVKDYIRFMLTGEAYAEYTDFTGANLVNFMTKQYDQELLTLFGIEEVYDKLPPLRHAADICGFVTKAASEKTGLLQGTPVAAGMFDVDACGIATGLSDTEKLCMIAGTWSINEFIAKKPVLNSSVDLNSMFCIPGYYLIEESSPTSAGNLEWFIHNLMDKEKEQVKAGGGSIYNLTNQWVAEIEPADTQIVFLPFLHGSNENPLARGTFIGLTAYHTKKHMLRAVYEGIVFSHLTHVKKLLKNREKPACIQLSGGAANSLVWVQIFADALQIPIETVAGKELGAQGAAMAAGIAAGVYEDFPDAIKKTVKITGITQPRPAYKKIYEIKYARYCRVIEALHGIWEDF